MPNMYPPFLGPVVLGFLIFFGILEYIAFFFVCWLKICRPKIGDKGYLLKIRKTSYFWVLLSQFFYGLFIWFVAFWLWYIYKSYGNDAVASGLVKLLYVKFVATGLWPIGSYIVLQKFIDLETLNKPSGGIEPGLALEQLPDHTPPQNPTSRHEVGIPLAATLRPGTADEDGPHLEFVSPTQPRHFA